MRRIYLDTNVFVAWRKEEIDPNFRGLFIEADAFFKGVEKQGATLVLSNWFFMEVKRVYYSTQAEVLERFAATGIKTEVVRETRRFDLSGLIRRGLHAADALHVAIAIRNRCDCIVTFNMKDFGRAKDLIPVCQPTEFG